MKTKEGKDYRFFAIENGCEIGHPLFGHPTIERIAEEDIITEYYIGGLYDIDEIDEWKKNGGRDIAYMPKPIFDEDSLETTNNPNLELYEIDFIVDAEPVIRKVKAIYQNSCEIEYWWDGSNHQQRFITDNEGDINFLFIDEIDEIESFEIIFSSYNGQGQGHYEIWKAITDIGKERYYHLEVSYWVGSKNEIYIELSQSEAGKYMKK